MRLHIQAEPDKLLTELAELIVLRADHYIKNSGRFSFVLSGGSSPKKLFEILASDRFRDKINWRKVFFFFGDERFVPLDHPDSNYLMAKKALFEPLSIPNEQVFPVNTALEPGPSASAYETVIKDYFAAQPVRFDFVLLGLGDDAHTASLFPHTKALGEKDKLVTENYVEKLSTYRITLSAPCINNAHEVAFLVYGESKAKAVSQILEGERDTNQYPAQLIAPAEGDLHWFMDRAAASLLKK